MQKCQIERMLMRPAAAERIRHIHVHRHTHIGVQKRAEILKMRPARILLHVKKFQSHPAPHFPSGKLVDTLRSMTG